MKKGPLFVCLGYIGDEILPSYVGIIINLHKDPHETTAIMESKRFFFVAQISFFFHSIPRAEYPKALKTIARIGQSDDGEDFSAREQVCFLFFWRRGDENPPNYG